MKKIKLDLDALHVVSFEPAAEEKRDEGTVQGFDSTYDEITCFGGSCRRPTQCIYTCLVETCYHC
ncbi:MAG TPA: hypothetical protein VHG91_11895 [Longimicrobium sp.]|nr:hypothetical protein [Longimicrobium sp.]